MADTPEIDESHARELLTRERKRREKALADYERMHESEIGEAETATAPEDDAEVLEDEQVDDALARQMRSELEAIERAEQRLEDGTYGLSVESGEPIPAPGSRRSPGPSEPRTSSSATSAAAASGTQASAGTALIWSALRSATSAARALPSRISQNEQSSSSWTAVSASFGRKRGASRTWSRS